MFTSVQEKNSEDDGDGDSNSDEDNHSNNKLNTCIEALKTIKADKNFKKCLEDVYRRILFKISKESMKKQGNYNDLRSFCTYIDIDHSNFKAVLLNNDIIDEGNKPKSKRTRIRRDTYLKILLELKTRSFKYVQNKLESIKAPLSKTDPEDAVLIRCIIEGKDLEGIRDIIKKNASLRPSFRWLWKMRKKSPV